MENRKRQQYIRGFITLHSQPVMGISEGVIHKNPTVIFNDQDYTIRFGTKPVDFKNENSLLDDTFKEDLKEVLAKLTAERKQYEQELEKTVELYKKAENFISNFLVPVSISEKNLDTLGDIAALQQLKDQLSNE